MKINNFIRPKCGYIVIFFLLLLWVYYLFFFESYLKKYFETMGTQLNRAEVNIGELRFSLINHKLLLRNINVTNHINLNNDRFQVDTLILDFDPFLLFRKKIIINNVLVDGIRYDVPRASPGKVFDDPSFYGVPSIVDRVSAAVYSGIKEKLAVNSVFKNISSFFTDSNTNQFIEKNSHKLLSIKKMKEAREKIDSSLKIWDRYLNAESRKISMDSGNKDSLKNEITKEYKILKAELENMTSYVETDSEFIKKEFPSFENKNICFQMFTPEILNFVERMTYWIELVRRFMPRNTSLSELPISIQNSIYGKSIHYGGRFSPYPLLHIKKVVFRSSSSLNPYSGIVSGEISDITTDQPILQKPLKLNIESSFPKSNIYNSKIELMFDHINNDYFDKVHVSIGSFPIDNFYLSQSGDLVVKVLSATGSLKLNFELKNEFLTSDISMDIDQARYEVFSRFPKIQDNIKNIFNDHRFIDIRAKIEGSFDKLNMTCDSNFAKNIGEKLHYQFRHELVNSSILINQLISNYVIPNVSSLSAILDEKYNRIISSIDKTQN